MIALRNSLPNFLIASGPGDLFRKFLRDRFDLTKAERGSVWPLDQERRSLELLKITPNLFDLLRQL